MFKQNMLLTNASVLDELLLNAIPVGETIQLTWTEASYAIAYHYRYRTIDNNFSVWTVTDTGFAQIVQVSQADTEYIFQVRPATINGGDSTRLDEISVQSNIVVPEPPPPVILPTIPQNLRLVTISEADSNNISNIDIRWNASSYATYYQIRQNGVLLSPVITGLVYIAALTADSSYSFQVIAVNAAGVSANSNTLNIDVPAYIDPSTNVSISGTHDASLSSVYAYDLTEYTGETNLIITLDNAELNASGGNGGHGGNAFFLGQPEFGLETLINIQIPGQGQSGGSALSLSCPTEIKGNGIIRGGRHGGDGSPVFNILGNYAAGSGGGGGAPYGGAGFPGQIEGDNIAETIIHNGEAGEVGTLELGGSGGLITGGLPGIDGGSLSPYIPLRNSKDGYAIITNDFPLIISSEVIIQGDINGSYTAN